jgi:hypothetical protein
MAIAVSLLLICNKQQIYLASAVLAPALEVEQRPGPPGQLFQEVIIRFTRELLEDFPNYAESMQQTAVRKLERPSATKRVHQALELSGGE